MRTSIAIVMLIMGLAPLPRCFGQETEACCIFDGLCIDLEPELCMLVFQGQPQGPGTSCAEGGCIGACVIDGECFDDVTIYQCDMDGGIFGGSGSTCATLDGACCLGLVECVPAPSEPDCFALGGLWFGIGTNCAVIEGCDGSLGACCLIGGCVDGVEEDECRYGLGGSWQETSICGQFECPPIGACCVSETAECFDGTSPDDCYVNIGGTGTWQGEGTTCQDISCPVFGFGACCLPDGECWDFIDEGECISTLSGTYMGDNVSCGDVDCGPTGACCVAEGTGCLDDVTEAECLDGPAGAGTWMGENTTCQDIVCPSAGFGACCLPDGSCRDLLAESMCLLELGGTYMGDGVFCSGVDCTPCPADVTGDDVVGFEDLLIVLSTWGADYEPCPPYLPADVDENCAVGFSDMIIVLSRWGPCP